jgi:chemotaxis methyl-accepting protein methylase
MDKVIQKSHATKYDRYPNHFNEITKYTEKKIEILSFGCSSGEEVKTLSKIYYPESNITGYDISNDIIKKLNETNNNKKIRYISNIKNDILTYDLILCMSVLCVWPENMGEYKICDYNSVISEIDKKLKIGGYLVIYNSKYIFTDTLTSKGYIAIDTVVKDSGFVKKYNINGEPINNYPYYLFKKVM